MINPIYCTPNTIKQNYTIHPYYIQIPIINKTFREYDFKVSCYADTPFKMVVYKRDGSIPYMSKGISLKYDILTNSRASLIELQSNEEQIVTLKWYLFDEEEDREWYLYGPIILYWIRLLWTIVFIFSYQWVSIKDSRLKYLLFPLLIIELFNGDVDLLSDRFRKTILRMK